MTAFSPKGGGGGWEEKKRYLSALRTTPVSSTKSSLLVFPDLQKRTSQTQCN